MHPSRNVANALTVVRVKCHQVNALRWLSSSAPHLARILNWYRCDSVHSNYGEPKPCPMCCHIKMHSYLIGLLKKSSTVSSTHSFGGEFTASIADGPPRSGLAFVLDSFCTAVEREGQLSPGNTIYNLLLDG